MVKTQQYVAPEGFNLLSAFTALFLPSNNFSFAAFKRNIARLNTKQELFQWTFQFALWQTQWTYGRVYWTFDLDLFGFKNTIKIVFQSTWMSKCHLHIPTELCDAMQITLEPQGQACYTSCSAFHADSLSPQLATHRKHHNLLFGKRWVSHLCWAQQELDFP